MDRNFELAAQGWINQCSADLKGKVERLLNDSDSTPEELADVINVPTEEIYSILEGESGNIGVETLIKVFMTLGLAVEIKPISETPIGNYSNVNPHVTREPQPNPFTRQRASETPHCHGMHPQMPFPGHFAHREEPRRPMPTFGDVPPFDGMHPQMPFPGHFAHREEPRKPLSPFATMSRDELTKIIRNKLWDSEININNATNSELVRFLEEKDKRMKEVRNEEKKNENLERDPQVADFVKRMKQNIKDNPQFRSYMKSFLNNLDED